MADPHHDAAGGHEWRGGESELLGSEHRRDDDIPARLELAIGFDRDARPKIVEDESLMRPGEAELPWQTRIMMQPVATSGAVANPNSSAPSIAAMTTSRPVLSWPSVSTAMRDRRLLRTRV